MPAFLTLYAPDVGTHIGAVGACPRRVRVRRVSTRTRHAARTCTRDCVKYSVHVKDTRYLSSSMACCEGESQRSLAPNPRGRNCCLCHLTTTANGENRPTLQPALNRGRGTHSNGPRRGTRPTAPTSRPREPGSFAVQRRSEAMKSVGTSETLIFASRQCLFGAQPGSRANTLRPFRAPVLVPSPRSSSLCCSGWDKLGKSQSCATNVVQAAV